MPVRCNGNIDILLVNTNLVKNITSKILCTSNSFVGFFTAKSHVFFLHYDAREMFHELNLGYSYLRKTLLVGAGKTLPIQESGIAIFH